VQKIGTVPVLPRFSLYAVCTCAMALLNISSTRRSALRRSASSRTVLRRFEIIERCAVLFSHDLERICLHKCDLALEFPHGGCAHSGSKQIAGRGKAFAEQVRQRAAQYRAE
jgi:hypothetical protein